WHDAGPVDAPDPGRMPRDVVPRRPTHPRRLADRPGPGPAAALDPHALPRATRKRVPRRGRRPVAPPLAGPPRRAAGAGALPRSELPPAGAGRGPVRRNRPGNARPRRLDCTALARRAVPG